MRYTARKIGTLLLTMLLVSVFTFFAFSLLSARNALSPAAAIPASWAGSDTAQGWRRARMTLSISSFPQSPYPRRSPGMAKLFVKASRTKSLSYSGTAPARDHLSPSDTRPRKHSSARIQMPLRAHSARTCRSSALSQRAPDGLDGVHSTTRSVSRPRASISSSPGAKPFSAGVS